MKKWYKMAGTLLMTACALTQLNAQTQYGVGAGMAGVGRAFFGTDAGKINTGGSNSFVGHQAGANNGLATQGTFLGFQAGYSNESGGGNTFVGALSGKMNVDGTNNAFFGARAGQQNTLGSGNIFIGVNTGFSNVTGSSNVAIGYQVHEESSNAIGNCAVGYQAAFKGGGNYNVAMGYEAGFNNTTGTENVFMGHSAGYFSNSGGFNTFVGSQSGYENTTGHRNAFFGEKAGYNNKEGFFNTFLGVESGYSSETGVGNVFLGNKSGYSNTNGHSNAFLGYGTGFHNTTGARNTYLGYAAEGNADLENATAIGAEAKVTASNSLVLGNNANVGIGISAPTYQFQLSTNSAAKPGSAVWAIASDSRIKKNITSFTDGLDLLKQINPVWFQYNGSAGIETGEKKFVGIIAQEMQKIAPYTIGTFTHQDSLGNKTEYLDYDANAVTYILINSVKEQQEVIEEKEAKIQELENRLEKLEMLVTASPGILNKESRAARLDQNTPNGFANQTTIRYAVPLSAKTAVIDIYTIEGIKVKSFPISERGEGELVISALEYKSGLHVYDLVVDGKSMGAKKMLVE